MYRMFAIAIFLFAAVAPSASPSSRKNIWLRKSSVC